MNTPDLTIVVPAYNEERRLPETLAAISAYLDRFCSVAEVLVVDDGSRDGTAEVVLGHAGRDARVRLLSLGENRGKGAAVRAGVLASRGSRVLFCDADQSTPIEELEGLHAALDAGAGVAVGSRVSSRSNSTLRACLGRCFYWAVRALSGRLLPPVSDTQCGFKLFRGDVARWLFAQARIDGFAFDVEILCLARGLGVVEVPVRFCDVAGSKVSPARDALRMLRDVWTVRRSFQERTAVSLLGYATDAARAVEA